MPQRFAAVEEALEGRKSTIFCGSYLRGRIRQYLLVLPGRRKGQAKHRFTQLSEGSGGLLVGDALAGGVGAGVDTDYVNVWT